MTAIIIVYDFNKGHSHCSPVSYLAFPNLLAEGEQADVLFTSLTYRVNRSAETCTIQFSTPSPNKLNVRFDSQRNYINSSFAQIFFYEGLDTKSSNLIRKVSLEYPAKNGSTFTTTDRHLTMEVERDMAKSNYSSYYDVLMHITSTNAATQTKWSLAAFLWIGAIFVMLIDCSYAINLV
ncbi:hypothetical protein EB796_015900 [Bugula neritina]|uniref:Uncharacterized protein n=1 Tax=Bugula neritina TaxID=10212 RepID=A0A7J7JH37_BUGNE|nr:hypothetical protein EB796_015900 [Bugula neritina]